MSEQDSAASLVRSDALLADPSVIALIRLPVGVSTLVTLGHPLEEMAKRKGGEAMMRQEGEWLVISANAPDHALAASRVKPVVGDSK